MVKSLFPAILHWMKATASVFYGLANILPPKKKINLMPSFIRAYFRNALYIPERIYINCAKAHVYTDKECGFYTTNFHDYDVMLNRAEVIEILINS